MPASTEKIRNLRRFFVVLAVLLLAFYMWGILQEPGFVTQRASACIFLSVVTLGLAYSLGAIPFGLVIARTFCGIDPREAGSGNIGATNVARLCGFKYGLMALACDILKGTAGVLLGMGVFRLSGVALLEATLGGNAWAMPLIRHWGVIFPSMSGFCAILGHRYSPYINFKGGKAVATTVGVFIPLAFVQLLISAVLCLLTIWRSGYVSLGSLVLVTAMPVCLLFFGRYDLLPLASAVMLLVFWAHRENIGRLRRGEEKSWMKKKQ